MSFKKLLTEVEELEKKIKKKHPKQKGRVLIANAKEITDYAVEFDKDNFAWYIQYRRELESRL
jgi:hypothetical protein